MASTLGSMGRNSKFECPRFDGDDFRGWWSKLEQFFEVEGILEQDKVRTVMLHMKGKTLDWHFFFSQRYGGIQMLSLETYARGLQVDHCIYKHGQEASSDKGKWGYSKPLFPNPKPISHVPASGGLSPTNNKPKPPLNNHRTLTKSLSQAEIEDRRKKGMCFWCAATYTPGHKCVKSQLYQLVVGSHNKIGMEIITSPTEEFQDCPE
ncbi:hypothetical protein PVK06_023046 [Gossypium arboreum]|uniref:Retrotransposon gag domain-containing protein n=1 Tax=Gossypium arboreum TaxID=29729 RepID=A0ABR0PA22_GOSAR|nr:hypothetical protein PVK06_023046 [Gossypium arboreum]